MPYQRLLVEWIQCPGDRGAGRQSAGC